MRSLCFENLSIASISLDEASLLVEQTHRLSTRIKCYGYGELAYLEGHSFCGRQSCMNFEAVEVLSFVCKKFRSLRNHRFHIPGQV
tara:strand:+ start:858 stop:1115 length:258 start_codon:yes stop_codon:yes gene_type:complete